MLRIPIDVLLRVVPALILCLACSLPRADEPSFNPEYDFDSTATESNANDLPKVRIDLRAGPLEQRVESLLREMTLDEKIGQLCQISVYGEELSEETAADLRAGRIGSLFYTGSVAQTQEAKRVALEESRLGIPLLTPRDVIHGFRTVLPIPLGQAASFNPELIERATSVAAREAKAAGVNWTFAPMLDISRDPRWGRIAESLGEDPALASAIARAMVRGYQTPGGPDSEELGIAACGKHFAAYGLSEGGRDYNRAQVAESELHNVFYPPFRVAVAEGVATMMTGFNTINGVPASANRQLLRGVLKKRWAFDGLVVSDWGSVMELIPHGFAEDNADAARAAVTAGVDMEMATPCFRESLAKLVQSGQVESSVIDDSVRRVLRVKLRFALDEPAEPTLAAPTDASRQVARELARQSVVMLKNEEGVLPLKPRELKRVALIGPLADAARDQLGCWMLDGKAEEAVTLAAALRDALPEGAELQSIATLESCLDQSTDRFEEAVEAARGSDVAIVCVGESWTLSGEARSRVQIDLPGAQSALVDAIAETGTPCVLVVIAGRPLTIGAEVAASDAVLYAWHPGTMGGPAVVDLLLGEASPSGKLPVTIPKHVGQAPLYYNAPRTGRPPVDGTEALIGSGRADFPEEQKYRSHYLDVDPYPLFPFGYGLSYASFEYESVELTSETLEHGQTLGVRATLRNTGDRPATEVAQLYVQDSVGSLVRPVRELKAFRRVRLEPGESVVLEFALSSDDLGYYDNRAEWVLEPGRFRVAVGGDSTVPFTAEFTLRETNVAQSTPAGATASPR